MGKIKEVIYDNHTPEFFKAYLENIDDEIKSLRQKKSKLIEDFQENCVHPLYSVVEGKYKASTYHTTADAPFRVCRDCGYAEEGWGCGYDKLHRNNHDIPEMNRDEARKFVLTFKRNCHN